MGPVFKNCTARDNGGAGFKFLGDPPAGTLLDGCVAYNNAGGGFVVVSSSKVLIERLGLARETDPRRLAEVLQQLQRVEPEDRDEVVKGSGLLDRLEVGAKAGEVLEKVLTVASHPSVNQLIQYLFSQLPV